MWTKLQYCDEIATDYKISCKVLKLYIICMTCIGLYDYTDYTALTKHFSGPEHNIKTWCYEVHSCKIKDQDIDYN